MSVERPPDPYLPPPKLEREEVQRRGPRAAEVPDPIIDLTRELPPEVVAARAKAVQAPVRGAHLEEKRYGSRILHFRNLHRSGRSLNPSEPAVPLTMQELYYALTNHLMLDREKKDRDPAMPLPGATSDDASKPTLDPSSMMTPIDIDRSGAEFALSSGERRKFLKEVVEHAMEHVDPNQADDRMALSFMHSKILSPEFIHESERVFFRDFVQWMKGRPTVAEDIEKTPWLAAGRVNRLPECQRNLGFFQESVRKFLDMFVSLRFRFEAQLSVLKLRGPRNLIEAYLYFKYIVREGCSDYMEDFKLMYAYLGRNGERVPLYALGRPNAPGGGGGGEGGAPPPPAGGGSRRSAPEPGPDETAEDYTRRIEDVVSRLKAIGDREGADAVIADARIFVRELRDEEARRKGIIQPTVEAAPAAAAAAAAAPAAAPAGAFPPPMREGRESSAAFNRRAEAQAREIGRRDPAAARKFLEDAEIVYKEIVEEEKRLGVSREMFGWPPAAPAASPAAAPAAAAAAPSASQGGHMAGVPDLSSDFWSLLPGEDLPKWGARMQSMFTRFSENSPEALEFARRADLRERDVRSELRRKGQNPPPKAVSGILAGRAAKAAPVGKARSVYRAELDQKRKQIAQNRDSVAQAEQQITAMEVDDPRKAEKEKEIADLRAAGSALERQVSELNEALKVTEKEREQERARLNAERTDMGQQISGLTEERLKLRTEISRLQKDKKAQTDEGKKEIAAREAALKATEDELKRLGKEYSALQLAASSQFSQLRAELASSKEESKRLSQELSSASQRESAANKKAQEASQRVSQLEEQASQLSSQISETRSQEREAKKRKDEEQASQLSSQVSQLSQRLEDVKKKKDRAVVAASAAEAENRQNRTRIQELEAELGTTRSQLEAAGRATQDEATQRQDELQRLRVEFAELVEKRRQSVISAAEYKEIAATLSQSLDSARKDSEEATAQLAKITKSLEEERARAAALRERNVELEISEEQRRQLEVQIREMRMQLRSYEEQLRGVSQSQPPPGTQEHAEGEVLVPETRPSSPYDPIEEFSDEDEPSVIPATQASPRSQPQPLSPEETQKSPATGRVAFSAVTPGTQEATQRGPATPPLVSQGSQRLSGLTPSQARTPGTQRFETEVLSTGESIPPTEVLSEASPVAATAPYVDPRAQTQEGVRTQRVAEGVSSSAPAAVSSWKAQQFELATENIIDFEKWDDPESMVEGPTSSLDEYEVLMGSQNPAQPAWIERALVEHKISPHEYLARFRDVEDQKEVATDLGQVLTKIKSTVRDGRVKARIDGAITDLRKFVMSPSAHDVDELRQLISSISSMLGRESVGREVDDRTFTEALEPVVKKYKERIDEAKKKEGPARKKKRAEEEPYVSQAY